MYVLYCICILCTVHMCMCGCVHVCIACVYCAVFVFCVCVCVVHLNSFMITCIWPSVHVPSHHNALLHTEVCPGASHHSIRVLSLFTDI